MKNKNQMYDDIHKIANLLSEIRRNVSSMQCDIQFIYRIIQSEHEEKKYPFASAPLFTAREKTDSPKILCPNCYSTNIKVLSATYISYDSTCLTHYICKDCHKEFEV